MSTTEISVDLTFREFEPADEGQVLSLFAEVFHGNRSAASWGWQFRDNSAGPAVIALAVSGADVVGHMGVSRQDWSYRGERLTAGYGCDNMVRAGLRGKGVFSKLLNLSGKAATGRGLVGTMGFTSRNTWPSAYAALVKHGAYERVVNLQEYRVRLGVRQLGPFRRWPARVRLALRDRLSGTPDPQLRMETSTRVPAGLDECLQRYRVHEVLCVWKDEDYLRWRYESHPDFRYQFHALWSPERPVAVAITRVVDGVLFFCDLIHERKDVRESAYLVTRVLAEQARRSDVLSAVFYGSDNGFFESAFARAGFTAVPFSPHTMLCQILEAGRHLSSIAVMPHNWSLSFGDSDAV